jgi:hypothetical protein
VIIKIVTTKHNTTPEEQWQKFLDELKEFYEARDNYFGKVVLTERVPQLTRDIVEEGLDVCKSLYKYLLLNELFETNKGLFSIGNQRLDTSQLFNDLESGLNSFKEDKTDNYLGLLFMQDLLSYIVKFSQENNLDFEQILEEHDEKLEKRGVKMKTYISEKELKTLEYMHEAIKDTIGKEEHADNLKNIIEAVER